MTRILAFLLYLFYIVINLVFSFTNLKKNQRIQIYDDVIKPKNGKKISEYLKFDNKINTHHIINKNELKNDSINLVEKVIINILNELKDDSNFIEYWWRFDFIKLGFSQRY